MAVLFRILQTESEAQRSDLPRCGSQDLQPSLLGHKAPCVLCHVLLGLPVEDPIAQNQSPSSLQGKLQRYKRKPLLFLLCTGSNWHFLSKQSLRITVWHPARWPDEFPLRQTDLLCRWLSSAVCKNENSRREDYHFRKFIKRVYEKGSLGGKEWWSPWETVP